MKQLVTCIVEDGTGTAKRPTLKVRMPYRADYDLECSLAGADKQAESLGGWAIFLAIKRKPDDAVPIVSREMEIVSTPGGTFRLSVVQGDGALGLVRGAYYADIRGEIAGVSHQLTASPDTPNWFVDNAISLPGDPITVPVGADPLAVPPYFGYNSFTEYATLSALGNIISAALTALTAGSYEVKIGCIDLATGKAASWIAAGHFQVSSGAVVSLPTSGDLPQNPQTLQRYVHADLDAASVSAQVVASGATLQVKGDPGTYGSLRWCATLTLVDAGRLAS